MSSHSISRRGEEESKKKRTLTVVVHCKGMESRRVVVGNALMHLMITLLPQPFHYYLRDQQVLLCEWVSGQVSRRRNCPFDDKQEKPQKVQYPGRVPLDHFCYFFSSSCVSRVGRLWPTGRLHHLIINFRSCHFQFIKLCVFAGHLFPVEWTPHRLMPGRVDGCCGFVWVRCCGQSWR